MQNSKWRGRRLRSREKMRSHAGVGRAACPTIARERLAPGGAGAASTSGSRIHSETGQPERTQSAWHAEYAAPHVRDQL